MKPIFFCLLFQFSQLQSAAGNRCGEARVIARKTREKSGAQDNSRRTININAAESKRRAICW
jgi:hypothetical protein